MIARLWHGVTRTEKAQAYLAFLRERAVPDYRATPGNLSVSVMQRAEGAITHFLVLTHWESMQAVAAFAGTDTARAKYYPEDEHFLLGFESHVVHYLVDAG